MTVFEMSDTVAQAANCAAKSTSALHHTSASSRI
jgi:hypothetical protein